VADFIDTLERIAKGGRWWTPRWCRSWYRPVGATICLPCSARGSRDSGADGGGSLQCRYSTSALGQEDTVEKHVGAPKVVDGRLWGAAVVGSLRPEPLPPDTEARVGDFADIVATAIANAHARRAHRI
jgi:GAF domain-containing protein